MKNTKENAIKLRKEGKSYSQISKLIGTPKSTLSYWLKNIVLSEKARKILHQRIKTTSTSKLILRNRARKDIKKLEYIEISKKAQTQAKNFITDSLFVAGISLYWAEGYKKGWGDSKWKTIDFVNSDPEMIKIMMKFFKKFLNVKNNDFKAQLTLHDKNNIDKALIFWKKTTKIPIENFFKTQCSISKSSQKKRKTKLENGTIHIRIYDVKKLFILSGWLNSLKNNL